MRHVGSRGKSVTWPHQEIRDFDKSVVTRCLDLLQLVLGDKMGASGKSLRQIYAELLGGGDGLERSSFPEIVGASNPSVNVDPARKLGIRD